MWQALHLREEKASRGTMSFWERGGQARTEVRGVPGVSEDGATAVCLGCTEQGGQSHEGGLGSEAMRSWTGR